MDPLLSEFVKVINWHIDVDNRVHDRPHIPPSDRVLKGHRRKVDLQALINGIVVSPRASSKTLGEIEHLVKSKRYSIAVRPSALTRFRELLPPAARILSRGFEGIIQSVIDSLHDARRIEV